MDFLQKKTKKNEGEVPQYYVEATTKPSLTLLPSTMSKRRWQGGRRISTATAA